jgi:hypothetical protein
LIQQKGQRERGNREHKGQGEKHTFEEEQNDHASWPRPEQHLKKKRKKKRMTKKLSSRGKKGEGGHTSVGIGKNFFELDGALW